MNSTRLLFALALLPMLAGTVATQDPKRPPEGGAVALWHKWVKVHPSGGKPGRVTFTFESCAWTEAECDAMRKKGKRWHVGKVTWPVLETSHPLQFDVGRENSTLRKRSLIPPGRYVLSIQNRDGASHFVFTEAVAVERLRVRPEQTARLELLGGYFVPAENCGSEFKIASTSVRLESDLENDTVELRIDAGSVAWSVSFSAVPRVKTPGPAQDERRRLERHLTRLQVDPRLRSALLDPPGRMDVLTLDPDSLEHDENEKPREGKDRCHGYRILGQRSIDLTKAEERDTALTLQTLLRASVMAHPDTTVSDCFEPRHALLLRTAAGTIDIVICFACQQALGWYDGKPIDPSLYIQGYQEPAFSDIFRRLGLKVAK